MSRRSRPVVAATLALAAAFLPPVRSESRPYTLLVDLDSRPARILTAAPAAAVSHELVPRRLEGTLLQELTGRPDREVRFLSLNEDDGTNVALYLLNERSLGFLERIDVETGRAGGGLAEAANLHLVQVEATAGARLLVLGAARLDPGSDPERRGPEQVLLEASPVYRLDAVERKLPPTRLQIDLELAIAVVGAPRPLPDLDRGWARRESGRSAASSTVRLDDGKSGTAAAFDIVLVGDGFTQAELPELEELARDFERRLRGVAGDTAFPGTPPFSEKGVREHVAVYLVSEASVDSGVTFCPNCAAEKDTAFKVRGNFRGRGRTDFDTDDPAGLERAVQRVGPSDEIEARIVIANCGFYGGRAFRDRRLAFVPRLDDPREMAHLAIHEMAHVAADLGDEYLSCSVERDVPRTFANVATPAQIKSDAVPWAGLAAKEGSYDPVTRQFRVRHECGQAAPSGPDAESLGLFWGAQFIATEAAPCACDTDLDCPDRRLCDYYRAAMTCKMLDIWEGFCRVCSHQLRCAVLRAAKVAAPECPP